MYKIGSDIIEVSRIKEAIERNDSLKKNIFSIREIEYCESKGVKKFESYAARFAAKEAYFKALGSGILENRINYVEILNEDNGKPYILVNDKRINGDVTLSHISEYAISTVILNINIEKN